MSSPVVEMQTEIVPDGVAPPPPSPLADATEKKEESSTADATGDNASEAGSEKKTKKEVKPVKIPMPEDYDFRKVKGFKPEAFPEGTNMASKWAQIRAVAAEFCAEEIAKLVGKHASSEMWPTHNLEVIFREKESLRAKANKLAEDAEAKAEANRKSKAERAEEKTKQLEQLKASLSMAMTGELMGTKNEGKDISDKIQLGLEATKEEFKNWAPKIKSWPQASVEKAVGIGQAGGVAESVLRSILEEAPTETVEPKEKKAGGKRKVTEGDADLVTPKKAKGEASSSGAEKKPGSQKPAYRIAKVGAKATLQPGEIPSAMKAHMPSAN